MHDIQSKLHCAALTLALVAGSFFLWLAPVGARAERSPFYPAPKGRGSHGPALAEAGDNGGLVPQDVTTGDWDGDGILDLAVVYAYSDEVRWLRGMNDGTFALAGSLPVGVNPGVGDDLPRRVRSLDVDGDGFLDLMVVCSGNPDGFVATAPSLGVLYGTPTGGFEPFQSVALWPVGTAAPKFAVSLAVSDAAEDGSFDLAVGYMDSLQIGTVHHRAGRFWGESRFFPVETAGAGSADLAWADLNGDGMDDLIVADRKDLQLWQGDGHGGLTFRARVADGAAYSALATADFDQDGAWDLAALDGGTNTLRLLMGVSLSGAVARDFKIELTHGTRPIGLTRYDANLDGLDDLALVYLDGGGEIFLSQAGNAAAPEAGSASLTSAMTFETALGPRALTAGDFNGDDRPDLAIVHQGDLDAAENADLVLRLNTLTPGEGTRLKISDGSGANQRPIPSLARPWCLAWDGGREALITIDRKERRLALVSADAAILNSVPLSSLAPSGEHGAAADAALVDPVGVTAGKDGDFWIADRLTARVQHYDDEGRWLGGFSTGAAGLERPCGMAYDAAGDRLIVCDESDPALATFSPSGNVIDKFAIQPARPLRALAWDAESKRLWGIAATSGNEANLYVLGEVAGKSVAAAVKSFDGNVLAPILGNEPLRGIAFDAETDRLWVLTDGGALVSEVIRSTMFGGMPQLVAARELSLLRRVRAAIEEPEGTLLLADGGLLATLVRLGRDGKVVNRFALNDIRQGAPIRISGLSRKGDQLCVLDGAHGRILFYDLNGRASGGAAGTLNLGRNRLQGLFYEDQSQHFWVGAGGRLLEYNGSGALAGEHAIPTTTPPSSLSAGSRAGEIAYLSHARGAIVVLDRGAATTAKRLKLITFSGRLFAKGFTPLAAVPSGDGTNQWRLVGDGDGMIYTVETGEPKPEESAVRTAWDLYP